MFEAFMYLIVFWLWVVGGWTFIQATEVMYPDRIEKTIEGKKVWPVQKIILGVIWPFPATWVIFTE
jgi:hypothetical protein